MKRIGNYKIKHGYCLNGITPIYSVWSMIIQRCNNNKNKDYKYYGGRGINICKEWLNVGKFIDWAYLNGYNPGLQIDRINNNGDYCPENCRFVTQDINKKNKRKREDFGIYKRGNSYKVLLTRNGKSHHIGSSLDIEIARELRNNFIDKLP